MAKSMWPTMASATSCFESMSLPLCQNWDLKSASFLCFWPGEGCVFMGCLGPRLVCYPHGERTRLNEGLWTEGTRKKSRKGMNGRKWQRKGRMEGRMEGKENDATWHTRENVSYYLSCAAKWYKPSRKVYIMYVYVYIYGSSMIVFLVIILLFERRTHDVTCRNMHVKLVDNLCCASKWHISNRMQNTLEKEKWKL